GALVQIVEGRLVRFRCHTGHAFTLQTLLANVTEAIDKALWDTLRAIEERILVLRQIERIAHDAGIEDEATIAGTSARASDERADALRALLSDDTIFQQVQKD